jgi:hypothetical protein
MRLHGGIHVRFGGKAALNECERLSRPAAFDPKQSWADGSNNRRVKPGAASIQNISGLPQGLANHTVAG